MVRASPNIPNRRETAPISANPPQRPKSRFTVTCITVVNLEGNGMVQISVTVDGTVYQSDVEPRTLLVHWLRQDLGKVGTVVGCDTSNCGACTVHLDGRSVKSCSVLAVQADGCTVTTIQGLSDGNEWHPVQTAFKECHGLQCGYCTPGMVMSAVDLLNENPNPTEAEIREGIEGNLCRCTGYHNIVKSIQYASELMGGAKS
jgi:aerobic carbon-monoxide dehydrogenase small subunit